MLGGTNKIPSVGKENYNVKYTKITEVNLFAFIYSMFHEDFSSILGTNPSSED